ncbi:hypothetical protein [Streptomyces canus]|uniref:hypothetical protein n=1 Tax=Streptomyces canus TaxID=58343 RepID=UPI002DD9CDA0|nr:hypothetical protein [Streptomyces canus]WSD82931.1 hypothetical protein OG925_00500 [Streptomyces canus]WSD91904.1 hypothetical protein OG925_49980 [Streptomyces canus]WSD92607.1 hypothetical protein OG925_50980 [Streptomyces canus]
MMIVVESETLAGLIGFGGAVVGAGGALLGAWLQQHHAAKTARNERLDARGYAAGEKALSELYQLRQHLVECGVAGEVPQERQPWRFIAITHLDEAELAVMLMPGARLVHDRVVEVLVLGKRFELAGQHRHRQVQWMKHCTTAAIDLLSAHMRGEPVPEIGLERYRNRAREHDSRFEPYDGGDD